MKEHYVIVSVYGGYYDASTKKFRGFLFATKYDDELFTKRVIDNFASLIEPCYIIKTYDRT